MSQSSSLASAITSNRWSADETLFFIGLLFELRVEKGPNSDNSIYTREAFQDILVKLNAQYPEFTYELETLERKYQYFRKLWAVFTDAKKLKGTTWDSCTGRVAMNRENEAKIIERHGQYGRRVVICGLIVGHGVTIETWKEIFQPSGVPLGRYIREAGDAVGFAQARVEARATRAAARKRKRTPENNEATDSLPAFSGLVGKGEREQPPSQSRRSSRMSGSSSSGTAAKKAKKRGRTNAIAKSNL
ncbi:hypothetical protein TrVGV298_007766 [Trichoderma virens]|nr:hypothetical protein TrVGV298_007766 [Trichoderma virens]